MKSPIEQAKEELLGIAHGMGEDLQKGKVSAVFDYNELVDFLEKHLKLMKDKTWNNAYEVGKADERERVVGIIDEKLQRISRIGSYDITARMTDLVETKKNISTAQEILNRKEKDNE